MNPFLTPSKLNVYANEFDSFVGEPAFIKEAFVKKMPNGKWRVVSKKGKNLGEYDTKEEANNRLKQVEFFKHKNASLNKLEDTTSYSAIMRDLNKYYDNKEIETFQKTYKDLFDKAIQDGDNEPEEHILSDALQCISAENISMKKIAAEVSLGDPEAVGNYLAHIVRFLMKRISPERRQHSIDNMKKKIFYLNEYEIAGKKAPASSSMGQSITLIKTLLLSHDPQYIRNTLNSIVRHL
jgi:hypothetical protein